MPQLYQKFKKAHWDRNRWLEFIDSFQFEIQHWAGKKHGNVNALSHAKHLPFPTVEQEQASEEFLCSMISELN